MENPYESPTVKDDLQQAEPLPKDSSHAYKLLSWSLLLVAAALFLTSFWVLLFLAFIFVPTSVQLSHFRSVPQWLSWLCSIAGCLLTLGYLLSVYTPSRFRLVRYALLATAVQLFIFSGKYRFLYEILPSEAFFIFLANIPSVFIYGVFLYLLAKRLPGWTGGMYIRKATWVAAIGLVLLLAIGFVATAGDAVSNIVSPDLLLRVTSKLIISVVSLYCALQLLKARGSLQPLDQLEWEINSTGP